jgi:hypothetical protein
MPILHPMQFDQFMQGYEKRRFPRYRYVLNAQANRLGGRGVLHGRIQNVSLGGCLIRFDASMDFEDQEQVEVFFETSYLAVLTLGTVQRRAEMNRLTGIRFTRMRQRGFLDLQELISELAARGRVEEPKLIVASDRALNTTKKYW